MPKTKTPRRRKPNSTNRWIIAGALVALGALVVIGLMRNASLPGDRFPSQGNQHVEEVGLPHPPYNSDPPTSGWHVGSLAAWGSYSYIVPDELLLHNLEDGGVVAWYPFGSPEQNDAHVRALQEVTRGYSKTIIAPREGMPTTYALTAWQRLQRFDNIDLQGMRAFLAAYEGTDHHNP